MTNKLMITTVDVDGDFIRINFEDGQYFNFTKRLWDILSQERLGIQNNPYLVLATIHYEKYFQDLKPKREKPYTFKDWLREETTKEIPTPQEQIQSIQISNLEKKLKKAKRKRIKIERQYKELAKHLQTELGIDTDMWKHSRIMEEITKYACKSKS